MKEVKKYDVNIYHLKEGEHQYQFEIEDSFFQMFEGSLVHHGKVQVSLVLEKRSTFIELLFNSQGHYQLICDRSLQEFDHPLSSENKVILKFGDENKEIDEDIYMILPDTQKLNLAQWIYEFIMLTVPMKKIHPDLADELDDVEFGKIVYSSEEDSIAEDKVDDIDPRWLKLKDLGNNN